MGASWAQSVGCAFMTTHELVEKLHQMRKHGPRQAMTMLFGVIFRDDVGDTASAVEAEYNRLYQGTINGQDKLNRTNVGHGIALAPYVTVNEDVLRKWRG